MRDIAHAEGELLRLRGMKVGMLDAMIPRAMNSLIADAQGLLPLEAEWVAPCGYSGRKLTSSTARQSISSARTPRCRKASVPRWHLCARARRSPLSTGTNAARLRAAIGCCASCGRCRICARRRADDRDLELRSQAQSPSGKFRARYSTNKCNLRSGERSGGRTKPK